MDRKNASKGAPVDVATMDTAQQAAYISSLHPGRELSPEEIQRGLLREAYKAEHRGHEGKHLAMFLIFVAVLAALPATVRFWRRRHMMSYRLVSIGSICLIPPYFAVGSAYYRFVVIWLVYAVANTYVLYLATREPLYPRTPRRVYQWFAVTNKASYGVFVVGMVLFALCFLNVIPGLTSTESFLEASMTILFYGLYFGLVSRDLVNLCTEKMAATLGYASAGGLPTKHLAQGVCCICNGELSQADAAAAERPAEPTDRLSCGHEFHATCIRGWCVVGKKDVCPFCREKVDLAMFKQNPWDRQELFYVSALEYMRFFVSWQPLTLLALAGIYWILGLD
ncbi:hypothetical protein GGF46_004770 [Coemansia sp. RSA 552]|nr:hypothetical protein GGF46_004770 [Coemansia sp. RSA 552]